MACTPMAQRLDANLEQWLLVAPQANPAMLEIFRDRDRLPRRDLVPWAGEFAGKYLTSAVLHWRLLRDGRLRAQIDRFVDELIAVQDADGYLGAFPQPRAPDRQDARTASMPLWDLWGHYHCMLGLLLWYKETGYEPALDACLPRRRLPVRALPGHGRARPRRGRRGDEHGHQPTACACSTRRPASRATCAWCARSRRTGRCPPRATMCAPRWPACPFTRRPSRAGRACTTSRPSSACTRSPASATIARPSSTSGGASAQGDRHNTGGFSSGEQATGNPYDPRAIETCCTVAWMALTVDMLRLTGDPTVADELELSTCNAALGAQAPSGRWWTYNTPMDGVRKASAHEIVFQAREGSPELNCCSVNGPRGLGMLCRMGGDAAPRRHGPELLWPVRT